VALAVVRIYEQLKRERAALDYDDLTRATLALLERSHAAQWVLYKLDGGLDHILVDEAQDTSPQQWKIVAKLAEEFFAGEGVRQAGRPRTLFAVGDEKQSIYSFQGADPEEFGRHLKLFKSLAEDAGLAFADLRPAISRRSARTVLEFVDSVFANDAARDGLSSLGGPIHHDPHRPEIGRVEIWSAVKAQKEPERDLWQPVDAPSPDSASVKLAVRIAERIQGWLKDGAILPGSGNKITPGDIMILVRRRNAFAEEMIRQLMERGVPVAGADRMVLMDQIAIADLVALGRFVLLPEDDLNLASLLKSPLVGLTEDELFALAQPRQGSLWDELRARQDESREFARANAFLSELRAQADFLPPFEFYARALGKGLRKKLVARFGAEAADAIDEFLALALAHESAHPPALESFLDWFERGASEVKRDMEQGLGHVRVMTVHGAKGLEANIVILPDTAQVPDHERRAGLLYTEDCAFFGVAKALETPPVTVAKATNTLREMREYRRLFYVALTRAREWLILTGYETQHGVKAQSWYPSILTAKTAAWREESRYGETISAFGADFSSASPISAQSETARPALPEFLTRAAPLEPAPRILRPSDTAGADEPPLISPVDKNGTRFKRGILIHTLLAQLPELAPEARKSAALAYLARQGLQPAQAEALTNEAMAILKHSDFAPLFAPGSRAEVAIVASLPELGNARISGQIDRLVVTEDTVLIADFKTNRPPPATPEETPALYRAQMALYRAALGKIYPGRRIDCALIWTEQPRLMTLPAELLDAEIARIAARGHS
jgi:ATP-dependent helicase/nuclease subunit A